MQLALMLVTLLILTVPYLIHQYLTRALTPAEHAHDAIDFESRLDTLKAA